MNGKIFDSHAHYDDAQFDSDRDQLLTGLKEHGVDLVLNCATSPASADATVAMTERYPFVYGAVGVHPSDLDVGDFAFLDRLPALYAHPKIVAIGEIGLDYHYDTFPRDVQQEWLRRQLAIAEKLGAPVIIHDREAHEDTLRILREFHVTGVVHCFSGSVEMMKEVLSLGFYIGLGGAVTFNGAKKPVAVAAAVDADRLLLETDCPYMAPAPFRGRRCDSSLIAYTAAQIAALRGVSPTALIDQTHENACRLFGIRS